MTQAPGDVQLERTAGGPGPSAADGELPPGPRLPALLQTLAWVYRPVELLDLCRRRYGERFTLRLGPLSRVVVLADPADARGVFHGDPAVMHAGDINGLFRPILGSSSILLLDGGEHLRQRRLLLPPFHGERMHRYAELIEEAARREVATWPEHQPFALQPRMQSITLEVIIRAVFGVTEPARVQHLSRLLSELLDLCRSRSTMLPWLRRELGGRSPWGRLMRKVEEVDAVLFDELSRRRSAPAGGTGDDVLSMLLEARDEEDRPMSDRELRDELLTLLVAGHETTATSLVWAIERLVRHPDALRRLTAELAAGHSGYLEAVIKETLRLRPVLPIVARKLKAPVELNGRRYEKGTVLMPCIYLLHRNPAVYSDPEQFHPERFVAGHPETYSWIPFGGGVRRCVGGSFAMLEMHVVLKTVLSMVRLAPARTRAEAVKRRSFTFAPRRDGTVVVTGRVRREEDWDYATAVAELDLVVPPVRERRRFRRSAPPPADRRRFERAPPTGAEEAPLEAPSGGDERGDDQVERPVRER